MNLTLNIILCCVLALAAVGVGLYRKYLEDHCDHYLHLHNDGHDASVVSSQEAMCRRIGMMDKLRNALIVAAIAYAVAIIAFATYNAWVSSNNL